MSLAKCLWIGIVTTSSFAVTAALLGPGCVDDPCEYVSPGDYLVLSADREELVGAEIHAEGQVEIEFTREDGTTWRVVYDVLSKG